MCKYCDFMEVVEKDLRHAEVGEVCLVRLMNTGMTEEDINDVQSILFERGLPIQYPFFAEDVFVSVQKSDSESTSVRH